MTLRVFFRAAVMLMIGGCATQDGAEATADKADETILGTAACFYQRQVSDFRALDRSNLIVYAPTKSNAYQVIISPPSMSLRSADAIAFKSRSSRVCGYAGERVLLDGRGSGREFSIVSVYRLDEMAHDALLAQYGIGKPDMEPEETTGAEIERDIQTDNDAEK